MDLLGFLLLLVMMPLTVSGFPRIVEFVNVKTLVKKGHIRAGFFYPNRYLDFFYVKPKQGVIKLGKHRFNYTTDPDYNTRSGGMPTAYFDSTSGLQLRLFKADQGNAIDPHQIDGVTQRAYNSGLLRGIKNSMKFDKLVQVILILNIVAVAGIAIVLVQILGSTPA
jgi:hypothetical protein